jgi:hypothetical protein
MLKPMAVPASWYPAFPGTHPARIVGGGGGVAGTNTLSVAVGLGAEVAVLDTRISSACASSCPRRTGQDHYWNKIDRACVSRRTW